MFRYKPSMISLVYFDLLYIRVWINEKATVLISTLGNSIFQNIALIFLHKCVSIFWRKFHNIANMGFTSYKLLFCIWRGNYLKFEFKENLE